MRWDIVLVALGAAGGLLVALITWRLQTWSDYRLEKRTGALDSASLRVAVGRERVEVLTEPFYVLYVVPDTYTHEIILVPFVARCSNLGTKSARDVRLELGYKSNIAVHQEILERDPADDELLGSRRVLGDEMRVSAQIPALPRGVELKIGDVLALPAGTESVVKLPAPYTGMSMEFKWSIILQTIVRSREQVWPGADIRIVVARGERTVAVAELISTLEKDEREKLGLEESGVPWWDLVALRSRRRKISINALVVEPQLDDDGVAVDSRETILARRRANWILRPADSSVDTVSVDNDRWIELRDVRAEILDRSRPESQLVVNLPVAYWLESRHWIWRFIRNRSRWRGPERSGASTGPQLHGERSEPS